MWNLLTKKFVTIYQSRSINSLVCWNELFKNIVDWFLSFRFFRGWKLVQIVKFLLSTRFTHHLHVSSDIQTDKSVIILDRAYVTQHLYLTEEACEQRVKLSWKLSISTNFLNHRRKRKNPGCLESKHPPPNCTIQ